MTCMSTLVGFELIEVITDVCVSRTMSQNSGNLVLDILLQGTIFNIATTNYGQFSVLRDLESS
jgi:hypothetical protein